MFNTLKSLYEDIFLPQSNPSISTLFTCPSHINLQDLKKSYNVFDLYQFIKLFVSCYFLTISSIHCPKYFPKYLSFKTVAVVIILHHKHRRDHLFPYFACVILPKKNTPFEAFHSIHQTVSKPRFSGVFLNRKVNARRSMHSSQLHLIIPHINSRQTWPT